LTYECEVLWHLEVYELLDAGLIARIASHGSALRSSQLLFLHGLTHATICHFLFLNISDSIYELKKIFETIVF